MSLAKDTNGFVTIGLVEFLIELDTYQGVFFEMRRVEK